MSLIVVTHKKKVNATLRAQHEPQIQKTFDFKPAFPGPVSTKYGVANPKMKFLELIVQDHEL